MLSIRKFHKKYLLWVIVLFCVCLAVFVLRRSDDGAVAIDPRNGPQRISLDYGTMLAGESRTLSFAIRNQTGHAVEILSELGCRCARVILPSSSIQASETLTVKVIFDSIQKAGSTGIVSERFVLRAKVPEGEVIAVVGEIKANIEPSLEITPRRIAWRVDEAGAEQRPKRITIKNQSQALLSMRWRNAQSQNIRYEIEPHEFSLGPGGSTDLNVILSAATVTLTDNAVLPCVLDSIVVGRPDAKLVHSFEIAVVPVKSVTAVPPSLMFDSGDRSKSLKVSCMDASRPFKITAVRSAYGYVSLTPDGDSYRVELVGKSTSGMATDEIVVSYQYADTNSEIRIPVLVIARNGQ